MVGVLSDFDKVNSIAVLLQVATIYQLHGGHLDTAGADLCAMVKLAADQAPEPLVSSQYVRDKCATLAFNATWQALQAPGWNDSQLAALQSAWKGCDFVRDMGTAIEMERAVNYDFFEQIKNSNDNMAWTAARLGSSRAYVIFWHLAWADQDEQEVLARWQTRIEIERSARTNSWVALSSQPSLEHGSGGMAFLETWPGFDLIEKMAPNFSVNDLDLGSGMSLYVIKKAICAQVLRQMAITAIALQRYRLQTGNFPADLAALIPTYLPALPRDGMDGKTLRYKLQPKGGFVLYSVGLDGKDDGGDSMLASGKPFFIQIWDGRDAVWPVPATDEEALAAMMPAKKLGRRIPTKSD
jgi:hypothetical protein